MTDPKNVRVKDVKHLDSRAPEGAKQDASVMTMEATVDATPQPLKKVRPYSVIAKTIPGSLPNEAQIVLHNLFSCFDRQKRIDEGLIGDLIWGFQQAGTSPALTLTGLRHLNEAGYVKFQAPDNTYVNIMDDKATKAWIRYQPKLLEMVYEVR